MADLNSLIAQGAQFRQPTDPFAQYAQMQQLQTGQNQNALAQYQLASAQRVDQEANALRQSLPANFDINNPEHVNAVLRASPVGGAALIKSVAGTQADLTKVMREQAALVKDHVDNSKSTLAGVTDQAGYDAWRANTVKNLPQLAASIPLQFSQEAKNTLITNASDLSKQLTLPLHFGTTGGMTNVGFNPTTGAQVTPGIAGTPTAGEAARLPIEQARLAAEQARVRLEGQRVGYEGVRTQLAQEAGARQAAGQEVIPPKELQKREAAYPGATSAVKSIEDSTDNLIKDLQALRDHPGLGQITGIAAGRLPAVTSAGRAAEALYDKVLAKGGFQMLQDLRNASKTGGALGNISNQEGTQLKNAFAAISRTQDAADVRNAIDGAIANAQGSKARVREAYDTTYEYKTGTSAAPTSGVDASNPLLR